MSNNIPDNAKKLAIKTEMLRHMVTARQQLNDNKPSTFVKMTVITLEIAAMERDEFVPNPQKWEKMLAE